MGPHPNVAMGSKPNSRPRLTQEKMRPYCRSVIMDDSLMLRLLLLCIVVFGCNKKHIKPDNFDKDPSNITKALGACADNMTDISGVLDTTIWRNGERLRIEQLFLRSKSGNLRIDSLSPSGQPVNTVVFDGGRLLILDQANHQFLMGPATRDVVQKYLYVNLSPDVLSSLLGGCTPVFSGKPSALSWDEETGRTTFSVNHGETNVYLWFEDKSDIRRIDFEESKGRTYRLLLGEYQTFQTQRRAGRLKFIDASQQLEIEFKIKEIESVSTIEHSSFLLEPPPGTEVRPL